MSDFDKHLTSSDPGPKVDGSLRVKQGGLPIPIIAALVAGMFAIGGIFLKWRLDQPASQVDPPRPVAFGISRIEHAALMDGHGKKCPSAIAVDVVFLRQRVVHLKKVEFVVERVSALKFDDTRMTINANGFVLPMDMIKPHKGALFYVPFTQEYRGGLTSSFCIVFRLMDIKPQRLRLTGRLRFVSDGPTVESDPVTVETSNGPILIEGSIWPHTDEVDVVTKESIQGVKSP